MTSPDLGLRYLRHPKVDWCFLPSYCARESTLAPETFLALPAVPQMTCHAGGARLLISPRWPHSAGI